MEPSEIQGIFFSQNVVWNENQTLGFTCTCSRKKLSDVFTIGVIFQIFIHLLGSKGSCGVKEKFQ